MNVTLVPRDRAHEVWSQVRDYLDPAVERSKGRWTMEHLAIAIASGRSQLWVAYNEDGVFGALTTEIAQYPGKKVLAMHFLGGKEFDLWYGELLAQISRFAKDADCDGLEGVARPGFAKYLIKDGFVKDAIFYEKGFNYG